MGVAFTMRSGSGMVIENSVPSGVRHCLVGHTQAARAAAVCRSSLFIETFTTG